MKFNKQTKLEKCNSKLRTALTPKCTEMTDKQAENLSGGGDSATDAQVYGQCLLNGAQKGQSAKAAGIWCTAGLLVHKLIEH